MENVEIRNLMAASEVSFGTSGARGLVEKMTDKVCYSYTIAFLQYLSQDNQIVDRTNVAVAGDLRQSSPRIINAVIHAVLDLGYNPIFCGYIPSPAVAFYGLTKNIPSIMVTGSHIPDDRNGIKFNTPQGEILKDDEEGIRSQTISIENELFDSSGNLIAPKKLPEINPAASTLYLNRYLSVFPGTLLSGLKIGIYQHSGVARDLLCEIIEGLGAQAIKLARSDHFIPVDTEAIRDTDVQLAKEWSTQYQFDAIVSTDGDGDRPLISNEYGEWLRGDVVGVLTARFLNSDAVVTPVSSNTVLEKSKWFKYTHRTQIGSPYVIKGMMQLEESNVTGYEANGGFLHKNSITLYEKTLEPLPTRDAILPIISILAMSKENGESISALCARLPSRFTYSDRIKSFPNETSRKMIAQFSSGDFDKDINGVENIFGNDFGEVIKIDYTDGVRFTLSNENIIHIRPSGNAPELRCYTESDSHNEAINLNKQCIKKMSAWKNG